MVAHIINDGLHDRDTLRKGAMSASIVPHNGDGKTVSDMGREPNFKAIWPLAVRSVDWKNMCNSYFISVGLICNLHSLS